MNKYCIRENYTIKEAIERIDRHHNRVAIVLNAKEQVIGVVSQGDIIRGLCKGRDIYSRIGGIIQPNFLYLNSMDMERAYDIFRKKKITLLPIVDENFKLLNVLTLDAIYEYLEKKFKKE